jgi:hypothetical protein
VSDAPTIGHAQTEAAPVCQPIGSARRQAGIWLRPEMGPLDRAVPTWTSAMLD